MPRKVEFLKKVIFAQSYRYCGYFSGTAHMHIKRQKLFIYLFLLSQNHALSAKILLLCPSILYLSPTVLNIEWEVYVILGLGKIFTIFFLKGWNS